MSTNNYTDNASIFAKHDWDGTQIIAHRTLEPLLKKYLAQGEQAIDIGTGTGRSRKFLESIGFNADGTDIDENMLRTAMINDRHKTHRYFLMRDNHIPHSCGQYHLAFSSMVVLEIPDAVAMQQYFAEAHRVLRSTGTFVLLTVNDDFYQHDWLSINTDFPENINPKVGDRLRIKLKDIDLELYDYYWTKAHYKDFASKAGFSLVEELCPKGNDNDGINWISEKTFAPFAILVFKKE